MVNNAGISLPSAPAHEAYEEEDDALYCTNSKILSCKSLGIQNLSGLLHYLRNVNVSR